MYKGPLRLKEYHYLLALGFSCLGLPVAEEAYEFTVAVGNAGSLRAAFHGWAKDAITLVLLWSLQRALEWRRVYELTAGIFLVSAIMKSQRQ
jgi:hypothetical protein